MSAMENRVRQSGMAFWLLLAGFSIYVLYPLALGQREKIIRFGIDLVGGTYITLSVETDKAVENYLVGKMKAIASHLKSVDLPEPTGKKVENGAIVLTFADHNAASQASSLLRADQPELLQDMQGTVLKLSLKDARAERVKNDAVQSNIEVLRERLNRTGTADIAIVPQGKDRIVIELPDVKDPAQARAMIGKSAVLEFRLVERSSGDKEELLLAYDGVLPDDLEILPGKGKQYYVVNKYTDITGKLLNDARPDIDMQGGVKAVVLFEFNEEGADLFYDLTSKNHGKQLAVALDGVIITAPVIRASIRNSGNISGDFTPETARELAVLLKSGSFVAPVKIEEERQIGPALGAESIRQGLMSCLVGLGLLFLFSIYYYAFSGFLAFLALVFNLLLTLLFLKYLPGATLTLPGIGGMVLTIGMAIDASILIYERMREELTKGVSLKKAVEVGFSDAMVVILDANITTFIVAFVLYKFGTGPIQGFAITMMLGIVSTLITGLFFLRSIINYVIDAFDVKKIGI